MTLSLSWYLVGFSSGMVSSTGNWWWLLLWLVALILDFLADAFRKSKLGKACGLWRSDAADDDDRRPAVGTAILGILINFVIGAALRRRRK